MDQAKFISFLHYVLEHDIYLKTLEEEIAFLFFKICVLVLDLIFFGMYKCIAQYPHLQVS